MSSRNLGHSAHYTYIDKALRARWDTFRALETEIAAFVPKPIDEFRPHRVAEIERLLIFNPDKSVEEMASYVDRQISILASKDWQFHERFDDRIMTEYVTVVMLSHALCEALINAVLAIGLANSESSELFSLLERADFKQKWLAAPKSFAPTYSFPRGATIYETLNVLSHQRNSLVHLKIEVTINNAKVLEGSPFKRKPHDEELVWLRRFFSLPYDLHDFARKAIVEVPIMLLYDRSPIEIAPAHKS